MSDSDRQAFTPLPSRIAGLLLEDLRRWPGDLDGLLNFLAGRGWHVGLLREYAGDAVSQHVVDRRNRAGLDPMTGKPLGQGAGERAGNREASRTRPADFVPLAAGAAVTALRGATGAMLRNAHGHPPVPFEPAPSGLDGPGLNETVDPAEADFRPGCSA